MMIKTRLPLALLLCAALPLVVACGSSQSAADKAAEQAANEQANPPTITDVTTPAVKAVKVTPGPGEGDIKVKPVIPRQSGAAPKVLIVQDLIVGTGAEANSGDSVTVQYVGVLFANGKEFDSSWKAGKPFTFDLGSGGVIAGWDQGVEGMKVGGRRRLIIPAELAYGAAGSPPSIPANAALVFDVDLVSVKAG
ncbi:MAG: FKBP-type peptidyl-prolyl cis-trans isomerase [Solirubrobacteraceae bacterium]|jgi:FKBP-type peptidyl-prolyl cis-trans isomerase|nr:FKBP-type peptidyl-prolyl cis-trans isomerase [Solirubrobacteraceae bacterium]MDP4673556.1 FKBP-type peptidyl-prolyl cis-trans isomerase [Solirubrobacteraceae bacterium]